MNNNLLMEELIYNGEESAPTTIHLYSYTIDGVDHKILTADDTKIVLESDTKYWIRVDGLSNTDIIKKIADKFQVNFLLTQDILNINHPTKIEEYDDFIISLLKYFVKDLDGDYQSLQITTILGKNYVITFSELAFPFMDKIADALEQDTLKIRQRTSDYLMSVLTNGIITNHIKSITEITDRLDDVEELILTNTTYASLGGEIQKSRKQYIQIKKAILPLKEQYGRLLRASEELIRHENKAFFNDVNDHLQYVLQNIELCRESLASLADLYISNNDLKMNDIMKRLTIVSTVFIPLTFLVGVWGMNFKGMPELDWKYGYLTAWIVMLILGLVIYLYFKMKKWY